jgi:hypothetical protein
VVALKMSAPRRSTWACRRSGSLAPFARVPPRGDTPLSIYTTATPLSTEQVPPPPPPPPGAAGAGARGLAGGQTPKQKTHDNGAR